MANAYHQVQLAYGTRRPLGTDDDIIRPMEVTDPALLLRVNRLYREDMPELDLSRRRAGLKDQRLPGWVWLAFAALGE